MAKFKTKEEAKEALSSTKDEKKVAYNELRNFEKENSLEKDADHSKDVKLGKKWSKLKEMHTKKKTQVAEIEKAIEDLKADKPARVTSYDYPKNEQGKEMNAAEKKKFRAKSRAEKKKAAKGEGKKEEKKAEKKEGKKDEKKGSKDEKKAETKKEEKKGNGKDKAKKEED